MKATCLTDGLDLVEDMVANQITSHGKHGTLF